MLSVADGSRIYAQDAICAGSDDFRCQAEIGSGRIGLSSKILPALRKPLWQVGSFPKRPIEEGSAGGRRTRVRINPGLTTKVDCACWVRFDSGQTHPEARLSTCVRDHESGMQGDDAESLQASLMRKPLTRS